MGTSFKIVIERRATRALIFLNHYIIQSLVYEFKHLNVCSFTCENILYLRKVKPESVDVAHSYCRKRNFVGVMNIHGDRRIVVEVNECSVGNLIHEEDHRCRNTGDPDDSEIKLELTKNI